MYLPLVITYHTNLCDMHLSLSLSPPSLLLLLEDEHHGYHEAAAFTISDTNDAPHAVTFYMTADNGVNALEKSINA